MKKTSKKHAKGEAELTPDKKASKLQKKRRRNLSFAIQDFVVATREPIKVQKNSLTAQIKALKEPKINQRAV